MATSPARRTSGTTPVAGGLGGLLAGTVALAASGPAGQTAARRGLLRLRLVEEVELDVVVVVGAHGAATCVGQPYPAPSPDRWTKRGSRGESDPVANLLGAYVERRACAGGRRPRPRALPAAAPARDGRLRLGLAGPRREERARRRAQDRRPRGQGGGPRRARGARGGAAPASELSPRLRLRARPAPRLHRLRVRPRTHVPRGDAGRGAERPRCDRGLRPDLRRARARASRGDPSPRRQAVERPARRRRRRLGAAARLRARPHGRGGDADGAGRRSRHARVHRAGAARRRGRDGGRRRLGGRRDALGGACGPAPVLADVDAPHGPRDRGRRRSARGAPSRPAEADAPARRPCALAQPGAAAVGGRARGGAARRVRHAATEALARRRARAARGDGDSAGPDRRGRARGAVRRLDGGGAALLPARLGDRARGRGGGGHVLPRARWARGRPRGARPAPRERLARPRGRLRGLRRGLARPRVARAARRAAVRARAAAGAARRDRTRPARHGRAPGRGPTGRPGGRGGARGGSRRRDPPRGPARHGSPCAARTRRRRCERSARRGRNAVPCGHGSAGPARGGGGVRGRGRAPAARPRARPLGRGRARRAHARGDAPAGSVPPRPCPSWPPPGSPRRSSRSARTAEQRRFRGHRSVHSFAHPWC